ncbi:lysophospholipid acyltransferase family protein [Clostridium aminobutyricum]|uniref:1-acyl-sn-glycerol-3-phosphate acyltransferase n=1 Tax=Clostridium aminobutyricum TaxID=33953 RepID=A0A939DAB4_CLOAM|nr:lysophospholipid acyltransferase family protein [Clostridium aminobutyricum]MBN7773663.1 1-acyl-sn-glycerol-3-phosphate acyltransferase [Clostridium aminobutyricum]
MRTIIWFIYFWLYLIKIYPKQKYYEKRRAEGAPKEQDLSGINQVVLQWASSLLKMAGVTCTVQGLENIPADRAVLFTSNHQGNFDIPLMLAKLGEPNPVIAKDSLEKMPMISNWMKLFDCLFIDRDNARQSLRVFAEAEKVIEEGRSIIIFPEGTRSKQDEAGEFKAGAFKIAMKTGAPIVPVAIDGSYRAMEAHGFWIHPAHVKITILPPIETAGLSKEEAKHISTRVRDLIMEANKK